MSIDPSSPVIALFGANEPLDEELLTARLLGAAIQRAGAVLLTGGDGASVTTVKDAAIVAAETTVAGSGRPAAWIGVPRSDRPAPARWAGTSAVLLTPGWDHRRNFVEACLCDAAFVVGGTSDGAMSEALFALFLRRPLVLLGGGPVAGRTPAALAVAARRRVPDPGPGARAAVDVGIHRAYEWSGTTRTVPEVRDLPTDEYAADRLVRDLLDAVTRPSPRMDYDRVSDEPAWDEHVRRCLPAT